MMLIEMNTITGKIVEKYNLAALVEQELEADEAPIAQCFALFKDQNLMAVATQQAVYLLDFENELKFLKRIAAQNIVFIGLSEQVYVVMMAASDEDDQEAILTCRTLYSEETDACLTIKRFMGQRVDVKLAPDSSIIYTCGTLIGRVAVPEMELQFQEDTKHGGQIIDFDVSETCIFTTAADSSLRLFDIENGMMLIAPMEDMECDHLAREEEFIVARCGQGQAMLVLKYADGDEELEEIDFIDLQQSQEHDPQSQQQETDFRMKGGHKVRNDLQDE